MTLLKSSSEFAVLNSTVVELNPLQSTSVCRPAADDGAGSRERCLRFTIVCLHQRPWQQKQKQKQQQQQQQPCETNSNPEEEEGAELWQMCTPRKSLQPDHWQGANL
jgi:hypothetical protein